MSKDDKDIKKLIDTNVGDFLKENSITKSEAKPTTAKPFPTDNGGKAAKANTGKKTSS